jgi:hypothetical protein
VLPMNRWSLCWAMNHGANVDGVVDVDLLEDASLRCNIKDLMEVSTFGGMGNRNVGRISGL